MSTIYGLLSAAYAAMALTWTLVSIDFTTAFGLSVTALNGLAALVTAYVAVRKRKEKT